MIMCIIVLSYVISIVRRWRRRPEKEPPWPDRGPIAKGTPQAIITITINKTNNNNNNSKYTQTHNNHNDTSDNTTIQMITIIIQ